jgi:hypothetical protein
MQIFVGASLLAMTVALKLAKAHRLQASSYINALSL